MGLEGLASPLSQSSVCWCLSCKREVIPAGDRSSRPPTPGLPSRETFPNTVLACPHSWREPATNPPWHPPSVSRLLTHVTGLSSGCAKYARPQQPPPSRRGSNWPWLSSMFASGHSRRLGWWAESPGDRRAEEAGRQILPVPQEQGPQPSTRGSSSVRPAPGAPACGCCLLTKFLGCWAGWGLHARGFDCCWRGDSPGLLRQLHGHQEPRSTTRLPPKRQHAQLNLNFR